MKDDNCCQWPEKVELFGIRLSCTDYHSALRAIIESAKCCKSFVVDFISVDPLVQAVRSAELAGVINSFECACPDGHPVRMAMNHLCKTRLADRVYGPDLMTMVIREAASEQIPVYFYGCTERTLDLLKSRLLAQFPVLRIAGMYAPPFRELTDSEYAQVSSMILSSGARIVFVGLGAPKQSFFAQRMRERTPVGFLCVGAAFDFLAGTKRKAPVWMQKNSLEWFFRLCQEPRRLAYRYTVRNIQFICLYLSSLVRKIFRESLGRKAYVVGKRG
ncbi:MAG: WecB/TagA/CpsF family glycosyltransferase [Planctomycetaceae bacterium]